jgi:hypothetical protein
MPGMPMGDDGSWMPDFRAALKPEWVPDFRQALTPEWLQGIREALLAGADGQGQPGSDPAQQPDIRGALGLGDRESANIRGALGMPGRNADGMPDFHSLLGGAGGSFTSDETMAAMNSRSADPTSKDDDRRNVVLDLSGDEGAVDSDLSNNLEDPLKRKVAKGDRPFPVTGSAPTFGQLYKRDGRAGRDADGDGKVNERGNQAAARPSLGHLSVQLADVLARSRQPELARPVESMARTSGEIRRALHAHSRKTGNEKMIVRLADGRTFRQFGDGDSVTMSPALAQMAQKPGSRVYHNHPEARYFQPPSGSDIAVALRGGAAETVYSQAGSVFRYSRGAEFDKWRGKESARGHHRGSNSFSLTGRTSTPRSGWPRSGTRRSRPTKTLSTRSPTSPRPTTTACCWRSRIEGS